MAKKTVKAASKIKKIDPKAQMKEALLKVQKEFKKEGFLLLSDNQLPSLTGVISGTPIKGSWWGHPLGNLMYNISNQLEDNPEILVVKLINKKVTYLDKKHWPYLLKIALNEPEWHFKEIPDSALAVLDLVSSKGTLRADDPIFKKPASEVGKIASKLEEKLLLYSKSIHSEKGQHIRVLMSWPALAKELKLKTHQLTLDEAFTHFDQLKENILSKSDGDFDWPWDKDRQISN